MVPNALLMGYTCLAWCPKSKREWNQFYFVVAYLAFFFLVMIFVFQIYQPTPK